MGGGGAIVVYVLLNGSILFLRWGEGGQQWYICVTQWKYIILKMGGGGTTVVYVLLNGSILFLPLHDIHLYILPFLTV